MYLGPEWYVPQPPRPILPGKAVPRTHPTYKVAAVAAAVVAAIPGSGEGSPFVTGGGRFVDYPERITPYVRFLFSLTEYVRFARASKRERAPIPSLPQPGLAAIRDLRNEEARKVKEIVFVLVLLYGESDTQQYYTLVARS